MYRKRLHLTFPLGEQLWRYRLPPGPSHKKVDSFARLQGNIAGPLQAEHCWQVFFHEGHIVSCPRSIVVQTEKISRNVCHTQKRTGNCGRFLCRSPVSLLTTLVCQGFLGSLRRPL
ncbi:predicted protein [Streptomyces albidoflavus]|nr:predicted protein [Streptomyces albidoflavus]